MTPLDIMEALRDVPADLIEMPCSMAEDLGESPVSSAGTAANVQAAPAAADMPAGMRYGHTILPYLLTAGCAAACIAGFAVIVRFSGGTDPVTTQSALPENAVTEIYPETTAAAVQTTAAATSVNTQTVTAYVQTVTGTQQTVTQHTAAQTVTAVTTAAAETDAAEPPAEQTAPQETAAPDVPAEPEDTRYGRVIGGVYYEMGDVTMDGAIDYYDAIEALRLYTEMTTGAAQFEERMLLCSVWNRDGVYTKIDKTHPGPEDRYGKGPDPKVGFMWWPFYGDDAQYLWEYVNLRQVHEDLTMQAFLDMTKDEVSQMLWDFDSHYRAVLNDQIGASAMGVVPIGTPDGFFVDGQYIVYGDLNLNGRFDEGDAELYELIAQEYEAAAAAAGGFEFSLRDEQYALASCRYINSEGNYRSLYNNLKDYPKMAALIRQYVEMSEAGAELPQDLGNFYEQYIAGQENP